MGKQTKRKVSLVDKKRSKQGEKKKRKTDRERERGERKKMKIFPAFRRSKLKDSRRKVYPRIASYA